MIDRGPPSGHVDFTSIYNDDCINQRVIDVLNSKRYVKGPIVAEFEAEFAEYCGTKHAAAVSNGTAAILLALKAADIDSADEVFVPAHTYFATVSPVLEIGAQPIFVDVEPETYTLDTDALREQADRADDAAAIIVTHMHGQPAEMTEVRSIAADHDIVVIEDAAQAHGAEYEGKKVGSFGELACFSFYPSKNMTVAGDGGMVTTDDENFATRIREYRNHGRNSSGDHVRLGLNFRLDETNAAVGREQLGRLDDWNTARREAAAQYDARLEAIDDVTTPTVRPSATHVYHHYPIQVPDRETFRESLHSAEIDTAIHYEKPVYAHTAVTKRVPEVQRPVAERLCNRIVSMPMHPRIKEEEINYVCDVIEDVYQ